MTGSKYFSTTIFSKSLILTTSILAIGLSGCASQLQKPNAVPGVNPDYKSGFVELPKTPVLTLDEAINKVPPSKKEQAENQENRLRRSALKDAALSYGARAGLAWETRNINQMTLSHSNELARAYDFDRLLIKGPNDVKILPPVISEAKQAWESQDAGKTLRVADTVYEIIDQARFTAVAPQWQTYLLRDQKSPEGPPDALLPQDGTEREKWVQWVKEGWTEGVKQAQAINKADLDRLERDYEGMIRYRALLEQNKVSPPVVADAELGTTGTGQDMRVNDRAVRITRDPSLNVDKPKEWSAAATTNQNGESMNPTATGAPKTSLDKPEPPKQEVKPPKKTPSVRRPPVKPADIKPKKVEEKKTEEKKAPLWNKTDDLF